MNRHSLIRILALIYAIAGVGVAPGLAQQFALQLGPPAAASPQTGAIFEQKIGKDAVLVVRPLGCADPADARITATAEGLLDSGRRSLPLRLVPLQTPGTHAVLAQWPDAGGVWVLSLAGTCAGQAAGAIVRLGPHDVYRRDRVQLVAHHPTPGQIDRALRVAARDGGSAATSR